MPHKFFVRKNYFLVLGVCLSFFQTVLAGDTGLNQYKDSVGWYDFTNAPVYLTTDSVFIIYKDQFGLGEFDEMKVSFYETDEKNWIKGEDEIDSKKEHLRYKQYYKGYEVENADFTVQAEDGMIEMIQGMIKTGLDIEVVDPVSESDALAKALDYVGASKYAWQDDIYINGLKSIGNDSSASYYPKGQLLIGRKHGEFFDSSIYAFVWSFHIFSIDPFQDVTVYINAKTGDLFDVFDPSLSGWCENGSVQTLYNGMRSFKTHTYWWQCCWHLQDCRVSNSGADYAGIGTVLNGQDIDDADNVWTSVTQRPATTAHWIAGVSWDFF